MADGTHISRRTFITSGAVVAAGGLTVTSLATGMTPGRLIGVILPPSNPGPVTLRRSTFSPYVGQSFDMTSAGGSASVVLREVRDLSPLRMANDEDRFSLLFHAPLGSDLDQAVYTFHNSQLGSVVLLAVPIDQVHTDRHYEVVVNRANDTPAPPSPPTTTPPTTTPPTTTPPTTTPPTTTPPTTTPPTTTPPTTAAPKPTPTTTTTAPSGPTTTSPKSK